MAKKKGPGRTGPNLEKHDGFIINQYGVKITNEEARALRNIVARVNYKAKKMEKQFEGVPVYVGTKQLDANREQLKMMGEEMDILIRKRSASLNQFRSKKALESFMERTQKVAELDYIEYRAKLYKKNLMKKIREEYGVFPDLVKGVLMRIQMTKPKDLIQLVGVNKAMEIKFHYQIGKRLERLMDLRDSLGLKSNMDDFDFEFDYDY